MKEYKLKINGNDYKVAVTNVEDNMATVEVNGSSYRVEMERPGAAPKTPRVVQAVAVPTGSNQPVKTAPAAVVGAIKSPLPGVILDVVVKEGDVVKTGQKLLLLEAMKMENSIESDRDGKVTAIKVKKGDSVLEGAELITIG
ncbi:MAG: biotin/lipoyl-binding protein [Prevotellaceae bacterium]|jgi:biotin carboxyl carrier protein|nr:biotin/lipoyl-binding protein [Prevotellaceae bacterium]